MARRRYDWDSVVGGVSKRVWPLAREENGEGEVHVGLSGLIQLATCPEKINKLFGSSIASLTLRITRGHRLSHGPGISSVPAAHPASICLKNVRTLPPRWIGVNTQSESFALALGSEPFQMACPATMTRCVNPAISSVLSIVFSMLPIDVGFLDELNRPFGSSDVDKPNRPLATDQCRRLRITEKPSADSISPTARFVSLARVRRLSKTELGSVEGPETK